MVYANERHELTAADITIIFIENTEFSRITTVKRIRPSFVTSQRFNGYASPLLIYIIYPSLLTCLPHSDPKLLSQNFLRILPITYQKLKLKTSTS